jgi:hypothetical protein
MSAFGGKADIAHYAAGLRTPNALIARSFISTGSRSPAAEFGD